MSILTANKYLLGSQQTELQRLGLQHQIWAKEAHEAWNRAGFKQGDTILDFGCGPGFCSIELGHRVGEKGKVVSVDLSDRYINFLEANANLHQVNVESHLADLHEHSLPKQSLDGAWCRWVLAWVENPSVVLNNIIPALKKGARLAIQEYYAWDFFRFFPFRPHLEKAVKMAFQSFEDTFATINIGEQLPIQLANAGLCIQSIRPITILATPKDASWEWPKSFLTSYVPQLVSKGYMTNEEVENALLELEEVSQLEQATCLCPTVIEIVTEKS
ncbi:MAG: methyltransferase domain-containing protein [Bacteroidota bacterium]